MSGEEKRKAEKKMLAARVTFLRLEREAARPVLPRPQLAGGEKLALMRAERCPVHFYRYLYAQIGRPHHWETRRKQSNAEVAAILHDSETLLLIFYCGGCPAGFAEILLRQKAGRREAELMYFGLVPDFQGRGLARFFLSETLAAAWGAEAETVCLQTNSLDSPRALQLYQQAGFSPVGTENVEVEAWD